MTPLPLTSVSWRRPLNWFFCVVASFLHVWFISHPKGSGFQRPDLEKLQPPESCFWVLLSRVQACDVHLCIELWLGLFCSWWRGNKASISCCDVAITTRAHSSCDCAGSSCPGVMLCIPAYLSTGSSKPWMDLSHPCFILSRNNGNCIRISQMIYTALPDWFAHRNACKVWGYS